MEFDCWDWTATQNHMPGPAESGTLRIHGTCGKFSGDGYELSLEPRIGGINPMEPFFDLIVKEPEVGVEPMVDESVEHVIDARRDDEYTRVTIVHADKQWSTEVEHVY